MGRLLGALLAALLAFLVAAPLESSARTTRALRDETITVGSFDFAESELLGEIYGTALEADGFRVRRAFNLGPREVVAPALVGGLIELIPEYAGTALQFSSAGADTPGPDIAVTHERLVRRLERRNVTVLEPAPAQDANTFVVTRATARRHGLETLSDLQRVAPELTFGGPPECRARPLCLVGLDRVYGVTFNEVVELDAGGPLTKQALRSRAVDVALMFSTDPALDDGGFVALADDRLLQPAENVTPLVRTELVDRFGPELVERIDAVSRLLTTGVLRALNAEVAAGAAPAAVATRWLRSEGLQ